MHQVSPTFARLAAAVAPRARLYARALELDLEGRALEMTDCWVNIMPRHVVHGLHIHPLSTISGTYYVQTPRGVWPEARGPAADRFHGGASPAPGRAVQALGDDPGRAGHLTAVRELVAPRGAANPVATPRISISFNFNWF